VRIARDPAVTDIRFASTLVALLRVASVYDGC
jgi:hypothetical protein